MALLEVHDLSVQVHTHQGSAAVVRHLSFHLERGETLGIIGESGSGKSLSMLAVMGLLPRNAEATGSIVFNGRQLVGADETTWCSLRGNDIGMVFQEPMTALDPLQRIGHQVAEPLRLHRKLGRQQALQQAAALLERVGIADAARRLHDYPHQFSGGQRQRIMIAAALACDPDILIADEPTTALDVTVQAQILGLLHELVQERGMALILVSHDLAMMAHHVQRMLVLYAGGMAETGRTADVLARMAHPYTRALLAARPRLDQPLGTVLPTIPGRAPDMYAPPPGCRFASRCNQMQEDCLAAEPPCVVVPAPDDCPLGHSASPQPHWACCLHLQGPA